MYKRRVAAYSSWRKQYGRLLVNRIIFKPTGKNGTKQAWAYCECTCGTRKLIRLDILRRRTRSCGCLQKEKITKHGEYHSVEYKAWQALKYRTSKSYYRRKDYYDRGIRVYNKWRKSFKAFLKYLLRTIGRRPSPKFSIDRIDNDGSYEPGNIRWATKKQQAMNRRKNKS